MTLSAVAQQIFPSDPPPSPFPPKASLKSRKGNYCRQQPPPFHPRPRTTSPPRRWHCLYCSASRASSLLIASIAHLRACHHRAAEDPAQNPTPPSSLTLVPLSASESTASGTEPTPKRPTPRPSSSTGSAVSSRAQHRPLLHSLAHNDDWRVTLLIEATISSPFTRCHSS